MNWKKQWLNELSEKAPKAEKLNVTPNGGGTVALKKKAGITTVAIVAFLALFPIIFLCLWFTVFKQPTDVDFGGDFVAVEINPSVVFSLDKNGKVEKAVSLNGDADLILSNENAKSAIIGKSVNDALNAYVDYAAKLGYVNLLLDAVKVSGTSEKTVDKAISSLENHLKKDGIYSAVVNGGYDGENVAKLCGSKAELGEIAKKIKDMESFAFENEAKFLTFDAILEKYKKEILLMPEIKNYIVEVLCSEKSPLDERVKTQVRDLAQNYPEEFLEKLEEWKKRAEAIAPSFADSVLDFIDLPKTLNEYFEKVVKAIKYDFEKKLSENMPKYNLPREEITTEAYEEFLKGIEETYGSVEKFWESKR